MPRWPTIDVRERLATATREWPLLVCALAALGVACAYLIITHRHADSLGFPLDDSYIYLTYAKQIGRLEPMTYYPDGPYSAGATSPLWPFLLAPLWSIGLRGYLFVYAAFVVSAILVATTTVLAFRVVERISDRPTATIAATATAMCGAFTYASLSAMEVGLAATMLLWVVLKLIDEKGRDRPSRTLIVLLALTSVTRPELTLLVGGLVALRALVCLGRKQLGSAGLWMLPLVLPLTWVVTNKLVAGNFFPNTGVAKSHFYLPGFTWSYYFDVLPTLLGKMFKGLFWSGKSPLWHGQLVLLLSILGIARLGLWARREGQWWAALVLAGAPIALLGAVVASSGAWSFHNYRYISASFPWLAVLVALGVSLPLLAMANRPAWRWPARLTPIAVSVLIAILSWPLLRDDVLYFAQGVRDTNDQVVKIGRFINSELPEDAHVAFHDAGAISYYGDKRGTDILGLVTNRNARHANSGPGSRFEHLERMPVDQRPTHFAYYRGWLGTLELFGEQLMSTPLRKPVFTGKRRLIGGGNMQVFVAKWDAIGSGHQPCNDHPGWSVVDDVDVADLVSEKEHRYRADLGKRRFGDPTARWTDARTGTCGSIGKITEGGRPMRGRGGESFRVRLDPDKDARLVVRAGGKDNRWSKTSKTAITVNVTIDGQPAGQITVAGRGPRLADTTLEIPASLLASETVTIALRAEPHAVYRSYHHFILQPR